MELAILGLLAPTVYFDTRYRRIPNKLTFPFILLGLIIHTALSGISGLWFSLQGLGIGLALLLLPFLMDGMGAGDVKLMGAVGALLGPTGALYAFLYGAIAGGVISIALLIKHKQLGNVLRQLWLILTFRMSKLQTDMTMKITGIGFPYGIAIAIGTLIAIWR